MKLSIIIVNFNTRELIQACLDSLFLNYDQNLKNQEYEIIVVDNASSDDSVKMIKKNFPEVQLIMSSANLGFAKANNIGIKKSQGEFILLLNPDTEIQEKTLHRMIDYLESHKNVGIATCKVLLNLQSAEIDDASHRGFPTPWRALCHFTGLGKLFPSSQLFNGYHFGYKQLNEIHEIDACAGAFLFMSREAGEKVKWLDEDYFWYGEDLDLCYKVKQAGYKMMYVPDVSILHLKGAASGIKKHSAHLSTIDKDTKRKITKARFEVMRIFYKKHYVGKYPSWVMNLVFLGISIKQKLTETIV